MQQKAGGYMPLRLSALLILVLTTGYVKSDQEGAIPCNYYQSNVGIDFNYARYRLGELPDISGYLAGVHVDTYRKKPCGALVGLYFDGRWNAGHLCSEQDECEPNDIRSTVADYITSFRIGYNALPWDCADFMVTPVVGVGFYRLFFELTPDIMKRRYCNVFIPVGFELQWFPNRCFNIGLNATYRANVHTRLKFTDPDLEICNTFKLRKVRGVNLAVPMTWYHSRCERVWLQSKITPFFDWNRFGTPTEDCECPPPMLPRLKRWHLGLNALIGIRF